MTAEDLDHTVMRRGKYSSAQGNPKTANQVAECDPAYLVWAYQAWADKPCSLLLFKECEREVADNRQSLRVARDQDE